ncbi:MAG TPA: Gfo/Idh/MocA family oxidoreductase [Terriglobales bacterium]|nr:Gfo/Idh/MocA family oxidoreductase [Terriglobales bacterium]
MVRYGILGFGLHAVRRLMPGFAEAKHCTVSGVWRRDLQKAKEAVQQYRRFPLRAYETPETLCASADVDAIFVASPDALHLQHVLIAVQHRKAVLCEKPMAMNSAECERMIEAAERAGVHLGVAQNFRFARSVNRIREVIAAGGVGKPLMARSEFHYFIRNHARTWLKDPTLACGGPVGDVAVHCIDALRYILRDEVASVYARALYDQESGAVEAGATLLLEFQTGTLADVTVSTRAEYRTPLWITCDGGVVGAEDALTVDHEIELQTKPIGGQIVREQVSNDGSYADQVDAFALSMEKGIPFLVPGVEGLKNQQVLDAAYRSIKTGTREGL